MKMADFMNCCVVCGKQTYQVNARRSGAQKGPTKLHGKCNQEQEKKLLAFLLQLYGWGSGQTNQNFGVSSSFQSDYDANPKDRVYFCRGCFEVVEDMFFNYDNDYDNEKRLADMKELIKDYAVDRFDMDQGKTSEGYESATNADGIYINIRNMFYTYNSDTKTIVEKEVEKRATSCPTEFGDSDSNSAENKSFTSNLADIEDSDSDLGENKSSNSSSAETQYSESKSAEKYEETAALVNNRSTRKRKPVNYQELMRDDDSNREINNTKPTNKTQDADFVSTEVTVCSRESDNVSDSSNDEEAKPKTSKRLHSSKDSEVSDLTNSRECQACPLCKKFFVNSKALHEHLKSIHKKSENEIFSCSICGKIVVGEKRLTVHVKWCKGNGRKKKRNFKCSFQGCQWAFSTSRDLKTHENRHTGVKDHVCSRCGATFGHRGSYNRHTKTCGNTSTPFECHLCDKKFKTIKYRDQHLNSQFHGGQGNKSGRRQ